jgi:hypothetical protein
VGVTPAFIRCTLKQAYLAPAVLEKLLVERVPSAVSIKDLAMAAELPWAEQGVAVFG